MTSEIPEGNPTPGEVVVESEVRPVREEDLPRIKEILDTWLRDPSSGEIIYSEVDEVLDKIRASISHPEVGTNVVALDMMGEVVGVMGLYPVRDDMQEFAITDSPIEINNAYVADERRGAGSGRALASRLEEIGRQQGHTEIVLNSGPRYEKTGWDFWKKVYGEPIGVAKDYYGPGYDAMVWRKLLEDKQ